MTTEITKLDTWVIEKIKKEYPDDVALLIGHNAYRLQEDKDKASFSYFFPVTEKGMGLARTFIIDGVGYDLFPMSWKRISRMAAFDEDNASVIADATILYCRTEEDRQKFTDVQNRLQEHLRDRKYMAYKALEKLDIAMGLYQTMMFEETTCKLRKSAGFIMQYLSNAVAYSNQTFFSEAPFVRVEDIEKMPELPDDFLRLFRAIPMASSAAELRETCFGIIRTTREYLTARKEQVKQPVAEPDFHQLADWYRELSYEWRQIERWGRQGDVVKTFIHSSFLQNEIDSIDEEYGLGELDLLGYFNAYDLKSYLEHTSATEKAIVSRIEGHGGAIDAYASTEEFLEKNR